MIDISLLALSKQTPCTDPQTGLHGVDFFRLCLDREVLRTIRSNSPFALALIEAGYPVEEIGAMFRQSIRDLDLITRLDENLYALLLLDCDAQDAFVVVERIQATMRTRLENLDMAAGIASCPHDGTRTETIFGRAAEALEQAKTDTNKQIFFFRSTDPETAPEIPSVLIVDDDPRNVKLLTALLRSEGYDLLTADSGERALEVVGDRSVDLVLLDVMMPGMNGYEVCRYLKSSESTRQIPVVLVTALDDMEAKLQGINSGADDFITKPPNREELLARCRSLIRMRQLNKNLTGIENVLFSMANAVEAKDAYTQGHIERVANLAVSVGIEMSLSQKEIKALRYGGILHDVGKIGVAVSILNKEGKLTEEEWVAIKKHPEISYRICLPLKHTLGLAVQVVRSHHEKLDGSGYPDGLAGTQIHRVARIMAVVDIYDALVTERPYRAAMPRAQAVDILQKEANDGKLDPEVVAMLAAMTESPS